MCLLGIEWRCVKNFLSGTVAYWTERYFNIWLCLPLACSFLCLFVPVIILWFFKGFHCGFFFLWGGGGGEGEGMEVLVLLFLQAFLPHCSGQLAEGLLCRISIRTAFPWAWHRPHRRRSSYHKNRAKQGLTVRDVRQLKEQALLTVRHPSLVVWQNCSWTKLW